MVSMEAYPELKSDRPLIEAQQTWTEIEAQITAARRFYNAAVNQLNNAIQIFPGSIIAGIAGRRGDAVLRGAGRGAHRADRGRHPRTHAVTADPAVDTAVLERRRRLSLRAAIDRAVVGVAGLPARHGDRQIGSTRHHRRGADLRRDRRPDRVPMDRPRLAELHATPDDRRRGRRPPRYRAYDGENEQAASQQALSSDAFTLAAFRDCGLVEPFESAGVDHILTGEAQGVPFAIAEISLLDAKGYRMFGGVLASFQLSRPRPGLTIVARDRGMLGNLLAHAGSEIERLPLEDPAFEGVFEVYGTDQVGGRVVLTTTMLERLKALDQLADAHGFACAFLEEHLLIAFRGMSWRCPPWRILTPVDAWLQGTRHVLPGWWICRWISCAP